MGKRTKRQPIHYVNNKDFLVAMTEWKERYDIAKKNEQPKPQFSNYIADCFMRICNGLSYRPNFINYTYRDEMVMDAVENCLQYAHNFNPEKTQNPFSYFTQIAWFAFLRRIEKEKRQTKVRNNIRGNVLEENWTVNDGDDTKYSVQLPPETLVNDSFMKEEMPGGSKVTQTEKIPKQKPKRKSTRGNLDNFLTEDAEKELVTAN